MVNHMVKVLVALLLVTTVALAVSSSVPVEAQVRPSKSNILFFLADDMREDEVQYMPQTVARLQNEGASFSNYYTTYPLCCPSRATMFTGMYAHNHGVKSNKGGYKKFKDRGHQAKTFAVALQNAGYSTGLFGKYLNGYKTDAVPPGWSEWNAKLDSGATGAEYYGYTLNENGQNIHYGNNAEDYQTDVLNEKLNSWLDETQGPFMAYVPASAPHEPWTPAERHKGTLGNDRRETLLALDELMSDTLENLEEDGRLENTYVFFASDNGWMLGEHGLGGGKIAYWEESASVQLLARGPGITPGKREELVGNIDLAPTFAELGGATLTSNYDGRSLVPLLSGSPAWRERILLENPTGERGPYTAVVDNRYKYVKAGSKQKLYDLDPDPREQINVWTSTDEAQKQSLQTKLAALKNCAGDECRATDGGP
jgi:arylsulfatase A-like enzyme